VSHSQTFAAKLIAALYNNGVKNFYLAPGSRSQALAIAANQLAEAGLSDLTIRLDERSMGFMALGRSLAEKLPVAVITTSGTAVANLHPAVLEAHHSGVPIIVLTADRPARLRGLGANQTTNQVGIFADALAKQAVAIAMGAKDSERPGPVQLNLQFQEPLSSAEPSAVEFSKTPILPGLELSITELEVKVSTHAVVVAGSGATAAAAEFALAANLPLFAEPTSGARFSDNLVVDYPTKLKTELAKEVDQVFVFGKPTLSRAILKLISGSEVWVEVSRQHGLFNVFQNAQGFADRLISMGSAPTDWLEKWRGEAVAFSSRGELARAVWNATAPGEQILFGASQIIRDAEASLPAKEIIAFANRGLAGIDGTVSTALGLAQSGRKTRALLGDLTLLHDSSALNLSGLGNLDVQLVVGNDHGGAIFRNLEVASSISEHQLEKLFLTPQQVDLHALAAAYGWNYLRVENIRDLEQAMVSVGPWLIEYPL
jgi:2-succinyl-5-enolpyruvyl-6-hydroxy-3-cyclohexene-1-carboxylate synthase